MVLMEGPLLKWTNVIKGYQQRWFVLDEIHGLLSYYRSIEKLMRGDRRGCIRLIDANLGIEDEADTCFTITSDHKIFHCKALSIKERDKWINSLDDVIKLCKNKIHYPLTLNTRSISNDNKHYQENQSINIISDNEKCLDEFNKKLTETDSYLQILIKQLKQLDEKIKSFNNINDNDNKLFRLKDQSAYFLDSVKHAIILLQISKNIQCPINGIYCYDSHFEQQKKNDSSVIINEDTSNIKNISSQANLDRLLNVSSLQKDCFSSIVTNHTTVVSTTTTASISQSLLSTITSREMFPSKCTFNTEKTSDNDYLKYLVNSSSTKTNLIEKFNNNNRKTSEIPDISYASSDDDYYFDANDESNKSDSEEFNNISENNNSLPKFKSIKVIDETMPSTKNSSTNDKNFIDYDKLYESEYDSNDELCVSSHGSVISHLISQVKIGMDLTKVSLPTFILERRSLLEMYADFFAHADLFASIPDYETPEERMIQVTKWYLSAFHAGRQVSIAKKPYNPILGEIFKCYWNLSKNLNCMQSNDGPVPWAKTSDLVFIAEQVSHHPPISAFYAENVDKRIMCSAQIWTKSKFLGLSIGVNNIGTGVLYLLDHNEEYTCTFPNAYGRSILTEPWFEMGGNVEIECKKSGYFTKIDFITKPFYGGKKHKIMAEIFNNSKKLIVTITGEWNGKMEAKWAMESGRPKLFIDTKTMPIIKKQVKPISEQEEFESRKLWKEVTYALKQQDVNEATIAKCNIEQHQRDLAKEREEKAIKWQNRMFRSMGNKWYFNNPLNERVKR